MDHTARTANEGYPRPGVDPPALVFDAAADCGMSFTGVAYVYEPSSKNPCLCIPRPLGIDAVKEILAELDKLREIHETL